MNSLLKKISYSSLNTAIYLSRKAIQHRYNPDETILLAGTGRGGTTLLAQIIETIPKTQLLWEPLRPDNNRECQKYGFGWHHYLKPDETNTDLQLEYMNRLISGEAIHTGTLNRSFFSFIDLLRSERLAIKFVNANRILGWIAYNFTNPIILLIRHPCAVVASQINHTSFSDMNKHTWLPAWLLRMFPDAKKFHDSEVNTIEEVLCWNWCIDTVIALQHSDINRIHLLTYESLIMDPEVQIKLLCEYLKVDVPENAISIVKKPSATASFGVKTDNSIEQLNRWKSRLSQDQISRIQRLSTKFGLDFYFNHAVLDASSVRLNPEREIKLSM